MLKEGWHFCLPFVVLLGSLFAWNEEAEMAALYACASIVFLGMIRSYKGARLRARDLAASFVSTGSTIIELIMIQFVTPPPLAR